MRRSWVVSTVCAHKERGKTDVFPASECDSVAGRRIRVLVVDQNSAARHAMATCVTAFDDMELAGEAADGEEALRLCGSQSPDIVLMAITMPGLSGAETTRAIHERWPATRVIGMSTFREEDQVPDVMQAGAVDWLLKNVSADDLAHTIRQAYAR